MQLRNWQRSSVLHLQPSANEREQLPRLVCSVCCCCWRRKRRRRRRRRLTVFTASGGNRAEEKRLFGGGGYRGICSLGILQWTESISEGQDCEDPDLMTSCHGPRTDLNIRGSLVCSEFDCISSMFTGRSLSSTVCSLHLLLHIVSSCAVDSVPLSNVGTVALWSHTVFAWKVVRVEQHFPSDQCTVTGKRILEKHWAKAHDTG